MTEDKSAFYEEYEVFSRKKDGMPLEHRFSLLAPNAEMALILAKENFFRREPIADLWVIKRSNIRKLTQEEREGFGRLNNKDYRETRGYADLNARWRAFKAKNGEMDMEMEEEEA